MDYPTFHPSQLHGVQLKDQELVAWLDKKLGDTQDIWTCRTAASFLSQAMIGELETCFQSLETHVKLKIVMGFSLLQPRHLNNWQTEINNLLEICMKDPDDWIEMISDMFRQLAPSGSIALSPSVNSSHFKSIEDELAELIKSAVKCNAGFELLPLSHQYVSHDAIKQTFGVGELKVTKHFNLRRRTKSSILKSDVLKSIEDQQVVLEQQKKGIITSNLPIRIRSTLRKPDSKLPMRGIPQVGVNKISGGFTNEPRKFQRTLAKREGGAKLIDIDEIPQALKKRRKEQEEEEKKKKLEERESARKKAVEDKKEARKNMLAAQDEARKLSEQRRQERIEAGKMAKELTDAPAVDAPAAPIVTSPTKPAQNPPPLNPTLSSPPPKPVVFGVSRRTTVLKNTPTRATVASVAAPKLDAAAPKQPEMDPEAASAAEAILLSDDKPPATPMPSTANARTSTLQLSPTKKNDGQWLAQKAREVAIRKQCVEMLRTANRLDITGQQMVIAFMSGNKTNPRPELGNVITLKLSEALDNGLVENQLCRLRVETFFQMDYSSGEWKRLRKCKVIDAAEERMYATQIEPNIQHLTDAQIMTCIDQNIRIGKQEADGPFQHQAKAEFVHQQADSMSSQQPQIVLHSQTSLLQSQPQHQPTSRSITLTPQHMERKLVHMNAPSSSAALSTALGGLTRPIIITAPPGQQPTLRHVVQQQLAAAQQLQQQQQEQQQQQHQQQQQPPHFDHHSSYQIIQVHPNQLIQMQNSTQHQTFIVHGNAPRSPAEGQAGYSMLSPTSSAGSASGTRGLRLVSVDGADNQFSLQQDTQHVGMIRTQQQQYMR